MQFPSRESVLSQKIPEHRTAEIVVLWPIGTEVGSGNRTPVQVSNVLNELEAAAGSSSTKKQTHHYTDSRTTIESTIEHELPLPQYSSALRCIRWRLFSVYRRLFTIVFLCNILALTVRLIVRDIGGDDLDSSQLISEEVATAVSVNLMLAILARNEHVVNVLFILSTSLPLVQPRWHRWLRLGPASWLRLRRISAKIYSYGGIHSGCAVASAAWYVLYTAVASKEYFDGQQTEAAFIGLAWAILVLLLVVLFLAHPTNRIKYHNTFEVVHRFCGWTVLALFWAQLIAGSFLEPETARRPSAAGLTLIRNPSFWCLAITTLCVIYPWARLRSREVEAEPLSDHALRLHFNYGNFGVSSVVRLADQPLKETHSFATIPRPDGRPGYSVLISNAGDWTERIIRNPPRKIYTRGAPVTGVLRIASLFSPVVIVATGSGIGPCLSFFISKPNHQCRILWSTRSPMQTYGQALVDSILKTDSDAVILDTDKTGRPDLVTETYKLYKATNAEAVVVISNAKLTAKVVFEMESRGVPAYGPIWDS